MLFAAVNITILTIRVKTELPRLPPVKSPMTAVITPIIANIHAGMIFDGLLEPRIEKIPSSRDTRPRMVLSTCCLQIRHCIRSSLNWILSIISFMIWSAMRITGSSGMAVISMKNLTFGKNIYWT